VVGDRNVPPPLLLGEGGGEAGEACFEGEARAAEVEADEAGGAEVCAVVEGEAVGFEVGGWVFEAEGADIEPCEVGGFDVGHGDGWAAFGEEGGEAVAIAAEVAGEGEAPWFAVVVGGGGGGEAERVGFSDEGVFGGLEATAEGGVGDDGEGEAEAGDVAAAAAAPAEATATPAATTAVPATAADTKSSAAGAVVGGAPVLFGSGM